MWSTRRTSRQAERLAEALGCSSPGHWRVALEPVRRGEEPTEEPMMEPITIEAQNWVAFPITPLAPSTPEQQKWVAVLTGIAVFELQGAGSGWVHEDVRLRFDDLLPDIFTFAERAPSAGHHLRFVLERTASVAAINSIRSIADSGGPQEREFGFAVDDVETNFIGHIIHCFDGLTIKVALASAHAQQLSIGFQSTLTGWIKEFRTRDELG